MIELSANVHSKNDFLFLIPLLGVPFERNFEAKPKVEFNLF